MAGRGNRSQGIPAADVLLLPNKAQAYKTDLDSILTTNSKEGVTEGVEMIEMLSKKFLLMNEEFKNKIAVEMTTLDAWTKGFSAIIDPEVSAWLNGIDKPHLMRKE
jgi:hypothetical protein